MLIVLNRNSSVSLQSQLVTRLKALVQGRTLRPGQAVPSTRELATDLRISRNTVVQAYDRLIGEGYLDASPRRGVYVSESLAQMSARRIYVQPADPDLQWSACEISEAKPFRPCQPDVRLFPLALWNRMRNRALKRSGSALLQYQSHLAMGLPELRRSLGAHQRESRGVNCDWRQIAITSGSQQALYLLADLLLKPGSRVLMEDPGYRGARMAWKRAGASVRPVPVDSDGMRISPDLAGPADLIYTTPSRQFPTGACLSLARRLALVEFAARAKAWIVEDDYDAEFRYSRPPLPSLQSLDSHGRVIYVGSMSKVLFPSLRIGYVALPAGLVENFASLRCVLDDHGPLIDQAALAEFIDAGAFYNHLRRCRKEYGERLFTLVTASERLGLPLSFPHTDGGMNLAGYLPRSVDDAHRSAELQQSGVEVPPLSWYSLRLSRPGLVFGFTAFDAPAIRATLKRIAPHFVSA